MRRRYVHLNIEVRIKLYELLLAGEPIAQIAKSVSEKP